MTTKLKAARTKAGDVENAIIKYFVVHGGWARKIHVTPVPVRTKANGKWSITRLRKNPKMKGMADVLAVLAGIPYRIEVKVGRDTEKEHQEQDRLLYEKAGGRSMIVSSVDDFLEQMEAHSNVL